MADSSRYLSKRITPKKQQPQQDHFALAAADQQAITAAHAEKNHIKVLEYGDRSLASDKKNKPAGTESDLQMLYFATGSNAKPPLLTNQALGDPRPAQFTDNGILQEKHANANGSCLFNAIANNVVYRIQEGLSLPEKFQAAFTAGLAAFKKTQECQANPLSGTIYDMNSYGDFCKAANKLAGYNCSDADLENIGSRIIKQIAITSYESASHNQEETSSWSFNLLGNGKTTAAHQARATDLKTKEHTYGNDQDLVKIQEATDLQFEIYEPTHGTNTAKLNTGLTPLNDPNQATVRVFFRGHQGGESQADHYNWLQVTELPQLSDAFNNYASTDSVRLKQDANEAQQEMSTPGVALTKGKLTEIKISQIKQVLSMRAMQQEHAARPAATPTSLLQAAQVNTPALAPTQPAGASRAHAMPATPTHAVAGGHGNSTNTEIDAPHEEISATASQGGAKPFARIRAEDSDSEEEIDVEDDSIRMLADSKDGEPPAKRAKQSTGSIIKQLAAYSNVSVNDFKNTSMLKQYEAVRHCAQGNEGKYIEIFTELGKAAGKDIVEDESLTAAIHIQRNLDIDPDFKIKEYKPPTASS
jgi:hypothetical protein